tara:strand:+ start:267 stop:545 length:279 start_codon:yes stop_codon:yes gene_type:complete
MVEDILELKTMLLNPKRSDSFTTWVYVDGWRLCDITIGSKKATVKPIAGGPKKTFTIRQIRDELKSIYWYAAKQHASRGVKKRPKNWQDLYA